MFPKYSSQKCTEVDSRVKLPTKMENCWSRLTSIGRLPHFNNSHWSVVEYTVRASVDVLYRIWLAPCLHMECTVWALFSREDSVSGRYEFIDLWTEVRDWSHRPILRRRTASKQIWLIYHKKPISHMRPRMNVERLLIYNKPEVLYVTFCVLNYGYGVTLGGSRQPWSADVFPYWKAVTNWWLAKTMERTLLVCLRNLKTQNSQSERN